MTVSLIVVSRHRPKALARTITAIQQMDHPAFELIVVADPGSCCIVADPALKIVAFDESNISAARNIGLAQAAGDIVAFIDDDAVPEPTWLSRLSAPFNDASVLAAGGVVRGRNGISFQWQAVEVDATGFDRPLSVDPQAVTVLPATSQRAPKVQGTNCAFRRDALLAIGGFDPAFRFYLDEADICLRLGGRTAIVPLAQVHHGFDASDRRRADRVPLTLHEIGASSMVFLRRHTDLSAWAEALGRLRHEQRLRLLRHMVAGRIEPRDMRRLMASLTDGIAEGGERMLGPLPALMPTDAPFQPLSGTGPRPGCLFAGSPRHRERLARDAQAAVATGRIATVFCFGQGMRSHRHSFDPAGFWVQTGGIHGRSDRSQPLVRALRRSARVAAEQIRLSAVRPMEP